MLLLSFDNIVDHFGEVVALYCLTEIERGAGVFFPGNDMIDPETRFAHACRILDNAQARPLAA